MTRGLLQDMLKPQGKRRRNDNTPFVNDDKTDEGDEEGVRDRNYPLSSSSAALMIQPFKTEYDDDELESIARSENSSQKKIRKDDFHDDYRSHLSVRSSEIKNGLHAGTDKGGGGKKRKVTFSEIVQKADLVDVYIQNNIETKECRACTEGYFSSNPKITNNVAQQIAILIKDFGTQVSWDRLIQMIWEIGEEEREKLQIANDGEDIVGDWTHADIAYHLTHCMTDWNLFALKEAKDIRVQLAIVKDNIFTEDEEGNVDVNQKMAELQCKLQIQYKSLLSQTSEKFMSYKPMLAVNSSTLRKQGIKN